ncbi:MAG TPA: hypothetical protein VEP66_09220 [Myxococcales bacterium]|nr:hypothetical protein [Myxococcales bacterium]
MRNLIALPLVAAVACSGGAFKDQARGAMPSNESVSMGSPSSSAGTSSSAALVSNDSVAGDRSKFFQLTATVAVVFNVPTGLFLGLLQHVVEDFEPTSCDANSCTWGPGSGPLDPVAYQLVVSRNADGESFDWTLSGAVKPSTTLVAFASGNAIPGPQKHHGSGSFTVDYDKAAILGIGGGATGQMQVTSYSNVGPAQLHVTFLGAYDTDHPGTKNNIVYAYVNDNQGGGDLDIAVHNTTSGDRFSVHSRWKNDGRGRADVAGLAGGYSSIALSECWSAAPFNVTYFTSTVKVVVDPWGGPDSGSESQCAYSPAAYSQSTAP